MGSVEHVTVTAGKDTLLAAADRSTPVQAVAELIWNGLDAEATTIDVRYQLNEFEGPTELSVDDNGVGMSYEKAREVFRTHGESWKKSSRFSEQLRRPLHGRAGRGRFLAYGMADHIEWESVTETADGLTRIVGHRESPNRYDFEAAPSDGRANGTIVRLLLRQDTKLNRIKDEPFLRVLTAQLAPSLLALPSVTVRYQGTEIMPSALVVRRSELELEIDDADLHGHPRPTLEVIEWDVDMHTRSLFLCDEHGSVITEAELSGMPPAPSPWSAYLRWSGFGDPTLMGIADLHNPDVRHNALIAAADRALRAHLYSAIEQARGHLIEQWKDEQVYPYTTEPQSPVERIERDIFDIVAVVASPAISKDKTEKRLSLRLLQTTVQNEPGRVASILRAVLKLSDDDQQVLSDLLERTELSAITRAIATVRDRLDFLNGLASLLYSDETRKTFREIDQLHPMVVSEPWVFGDEWTLSSSESGLTRVVKAALDQLGADAKFAPRAVRQPSGKTGRVDIVFHRELPESESTRHLVVELKRPMKLTMNEFGQLNNYATAITAHAEVTASHSWDFWLVGTEIDHAVTNLQTDPMNPGLTTNSDRYRIWIVSWGALLDRARRRLDLLRAQLDLGTSDEDGLAYLKRVHAERIPSGL